MLCFMCLAIDLIMYVLISCVLTLVVVLGRGSGGGLINVASTGRGDRNVTCCAGSLVDCGFA